MQEPLFLDGERIYLRALVESDLAGAYVSWLNDPVVSAYNGHHVFPYTVDAARTYIQEMKDHRAHLVLAIVAKDTGTHIGNISLQHIDTISRCAEYAIMLGDQAYTGKGIAAEASRLIIAHGFTALNLHRIYCGTSQKNEAMQRLALKLGFQKEGVRRQAFFKSGTYVDLTEYGMLAPEFIP